MAEEAANNSPAIQIQIEPETDSVIEKNENINRNEDEISKKKFSKYHQTHRFSLRDEKVTDDFRKVSRKVKKFTFEPDEEDEEEEEQQKQRRGYEESEDSQLSLLKPLDECDEIKRMEASRRRKSSTIALMKLETTLSMENATTPTTTQHIYRMTKKRTSKDNNNPSSSTPIVARSDRMKKRRDTIAI